MVVGLKQGLTYVEIHMLADGSVTVISVMPGEGSLYFSLAVGIKDLTVSKTYKIRKWPGESEIRLPVLLDPFIALFTWMILRGNSPGYLFCDVNRNNMISTDKPWSVSSFQDFIRNRLRMCVVGSNDMLWCTGHSINRGSAELCRWIGVRDQQICGWIPMKGQNVYTNYGAAYNDCQAVALPRFSIW